MVPIAARYAGRGTCFSVAIIASGSNRSRNSAQMGPSSRATANRLHAGPSRLEASRGLALKPQDSVQEPKEVVHFHVLETLIELIDS
jgi:hypothetical protein